MLFNSYSFIAVFLPLTFLGFVVTGRISRTAQVAWLTLASLAFYGWWDWRNVGLLLCSMLFNMVMGTTVAGRRPALVFAISVNLAVLGFFKYWDFFAANVDLPALQNVLPLGISFFTFTQIAFLVDCYRGEAKERRPLNYGLFVTFFPHLIAGPLFHHKQIMPQFADPHRSKLNADNLALGSTIFLIGLFKKVVVADGLAPIADQLFASSGNVTMVEASFGVLAYTLQIYFDFSGYSDMAIGLARMLNIDIPINFNSPYKATSIIEFWQRWHMTLSQFLRDYLYIPLGGNRKGRSRRYLNLVVTMLLGGLWHGAAWTFVVWGGLHGLFLVINHFWRGWQRRPKLHPLLALGLTFFCVQVGWVFFRASDMEAALNILASISGWNGIAPPQLQKALGGFETIVAVGALVPAVWLLPNSQEIVGLVRSSNSAPAWRPSLAWGLVIGGVACWCLALLGKPTTFLYYQF